MRSHQLPSPSPRDRGGYYDGVRTTIPPPPSPEEEVFNIIPIHNLLADHPSLRYPEVRAATASLSAVSDLRKPPFRWTDDMDLLDWVGLFFGFQIDNVRNQREHIVLHLANSQMRLQPPPDDIYALDPTVSRSFRRILLQNYTSWCSYLGIKSNVWISDYRGNDISGSDHRRELLYSSLYLLIWGESANLRFVPECICYIFHNMAMELNKILEDYTNETTSLSVLPSTSSENGFLNDVVTPIYQTIKAEVESSLNGTAPHSVWRNYDDINEYFWSRRCLQHLKWPIDVGCNFFVTSGQRGRVGKTGFVEHRSFFNIFQSFDRLWIMHILFLQAAIIVAWDSKSTFPWEALEDRNIQVKCLTVFVTWGGLRFLQSLLDARTQYSLISGETLLVGVRMLLKIIVAAGWTIFFRVMYRKIWHQKNHDGGWSTEANQLVMNFLHAALVFIIPELLSLIFFILPWISNFIEGTNWRIFHMLTWWFQSRTFVGCGMREGVFDNIKYTLFWILVLATKFCFSYFLQIKPLIEPTKAVSRLKDIQYNWHMFVDDTNRIAVGLLWLPVILIYLMDVQVWFSIYSCFAGTMVGFFAQLGEIRNIKNWALRFQFFASAMQFNLMPEEQSFRTRGLLKNKFSDAIRRLRLRYGLGFPYKKLELHKVEAHKFALIWNEIITTFREEDIVSDQEVELLELPANTWNIRVIRWPCLLLCNELMMALIQAKELQDAPDRWLWEKICKSEYRRCAVIEAYDSIKHMLLEIVKNHTKGNSIIRTLFGEIDHAILYKKFTKTYNMSALPQVHAKLISLVELLDKPKKDVSKLVSALQALCEVLIHDFSKELRTMEKFREEGLASQRLEGNIVLPFENIVEVPDDDNISFYRQVRRLQTILTSVDSIHKVPINLEARRRITFFSNSLFMNMPRAPQVEKMMAFSVLTPYHNEEILYSKEQLRIENEDGTSTLSYLQNIYNDEWENFKERMRRDGMVDEKEMWTTRLADLRLWASYRGQTLSRTVRGMMYYNRALKLLAFLDSASDMDFRKGSVELSAVGSMRQDDEVVECLDSGPESSSRNFIRASSGVDQLFKGHEHGTALMKYTYVVACQIYGTQKAKKDPHADDILYLMKNNEALRVAYVDEVYMGKEKVEYYSVLMKYDQRLQKEVQIYRIRLPGYFKIGEGKPENQNHALIFTRGDAVQTIDMNQDNYFEEALKMRNLLEEYKKYYGIRKPTILGVREHIFTVPVSSLAWFMSAKEMSFVTLRQRVLANPLKVRMHYGHPDVFDRYWFLTRGGISKASRVININEDIFAGFNCTLRGGNVTHHEYIQVGKGKDVGLNQISTFEAKIASGNGEQILSRDVYRLGQRLDFFRMLSFFYTTVGFFSNTMMVVLSIYAFVWGRLYLALSGIEEGMKTSVNNKAFCAILNQLFIIQLGLYTALPNIVVNSLEHGFLNAVWDFLTMQLQCSSVFCSFSMGTLSHYFGRTVLHGGAKYCATGRGFAMQHRSFAENYRLYARSHFVKAIELGLVSILYASYSPMVKDTSVYIAMTICSWFLVVSWILSPFVFNPSGFDWLKTVYDFDDFMTWIWYCDGVYTKAEQSWETWWNEEHDCLRTTGLWGKLLEIILDLRYFFFQYGVVHQLSIASGSTSVAVYLFSLSYMAGVVGIYVIIAYARDKSAAKEHIYYRLVQFLAVIFVIILAVLLLRFTQFNFIDLLTGFLAFIPTGWGVISIAKVFKPFLQSTMMWGTVTSVARLYDILFGMIIMVPIASLSWLPGFQYMQTRILFHKAFSRGFQISHSKKSTKDL